MCCVCMCVCVSVCACVHVCMQFCLGSSVCGGGGGGLQQENSEALHELFGMHEIIGENYTITLTIPFVHKTSMHNGFASNCMF